MLTDEHLKAIGRVALMYTRLDFIVTTFIATLLCSDQRVGQAIAPRMMWPKIDLLQTLFAMLPSVNVPEKHQASLAQWDVEPVTPERLAEFQTLLSNARAAVTARNDIMHAFVWGQQETTAGAFVPAIFKIKTGKDGATMAGQAMPVERVEEIAQQLENASAGLGTFMMRHTRQGGDDVQPLLGRGTHWEMAVKKALSWSTKGPRPGQPKEEKG